jgi:hypothetical protein
MIRQRAATASLRDDTMAQARLFSFDCISHDFGRGINMPRSFREASHVADSDSHAAAAARNKFGLWPSGLEIISAA